MGVGGRGRAAAARANLKATRRNNANNMYAPVGQQDSMEPIPNQSNWTAAAQTRGDFERRCGGPVTMPSLEDIPRATSAPPILPERLATRSAELLGRAANLEGMDSYTDVRYDEDYHEFYERSDNKRHLPPPVDSNTLYKDMQIFVAEQQQYKEPSAFHAWNNRYGNSHPFGIGHGSQSSLNWRGMTDTLLTLVDRHLGLATVEEQPHVRKASMDESLAEAIKNQLQLGSEIQRPGSQPAPNLLQAAIAEAGHFRSASAFPSFDVDCLAGMSNTIPPTSSPAPAASLNSLLSSTGGTDYLNSPQTQQGRATFPGNLEYRAFQAAYQAALMQQNPTMMVQQPGLGMTGGNFGNGLVPTGLQTDMQGIPNNDPPMHSYFTQSHSGPGMDYGGGQRFDMFEEQSLHREEHVGRRKPFGRRPRDRDRDLTYVNDAYCDNQYFKFSSIEEVVGQVMQVAQDQNGCRFLQRKFDEGGAQTIAYVFSEIVDNIVRLMKDPFGNYLIQKLLDRCSEDQRTEVVKAVAEKGELVSIALSTHGTRAVQKLIETLKIKEQRTRVIDALKPGVVNLIKDLNGNHVIQRCLQRLGPEDSQFIYDAAIRYCVEIASHRHGCCVLQRCIDFATDEQKNSMIMEISANALVLSQDAFGNYVVQYVLDLGQPEASQRIMTVLTGHYSDLAVQKFSSNVVEKCLKLQGLDDARESIIREIMASPSLPRLLQDPYGNYVIQSALTVTSGSLHQSLVDCIHPFLPTLRGTPHGKRILQKVLASLKDPYTP